MNTSLFLSGTALSRRWQNRDSFVVFQTAFGDGLPFLRTWAAWRSDPAAPGRLHFFALEEHPLSPDALAPHTAREPGLEELAGLLRAQWPLRVPGFHRLEFDNARVVLTLGFGSPQTLAPQIQAEVDAFFVAPPIPSAGPATAFPHRILARLAAPEATLAAFGLSETQREELLGSGFIAGPGAASGFWNGQLPPEHQRRRRARPSARSAVVVGAGLAGTAIAWRLAQRGWETTLVERHPHPAQEASGNRAAVLSPMVSRDDSLSARLSRACFLHLLREIHGLSRLGFPVQWSDCGVLQLAKKPGEERAMEEIARGFPEEYLRFLDPATVSARVGRPISAGGYFFPMGGCVNPVSLCEARLRAAGEGIRRCFSRQALQIRQTPEGWMVSGENSEPLAQAPVLVLANAHDALSFPPIQGLRLKKVRGQVTHLPAEILPPVPHVVCRDGYLTPALDGFCCLGATFDFDTDSRVLEPEGHRANLARLPELIGWELPEADPAGFTGRVGFRTLTPDRLPVVGAVPDFTQAASGDLRKIARLPGLYAELGLGSRGLVWSSLMAELLACQITGEPLPLERVLAEATDPARFWVRARRENAGRSAGASKGAPIEARMKRLSK
jgi:tRNA 5-methylaminomethyl-2-thiouridine biosynthesis bifunctional protein